MKQLLIFITVILLITLGIVIDNRVQQNNIMYYHPSGCCMLTVQHQVSDDNTPTYLIHYHDYKLGDEYESIEVNIVDMKFMVNEYVQHCVDNH